MIAGNYLHDLTVRLGQGLARLPTALRTRHIAYLRSAQNADGGFSGREGGSDLYYTGFALRGLAVLDALTPDICTRAAVFLGQSLTREASIVDFFSLLYSCRLVQMGGGPDVLANSPPDWPDRVAAVLATFRGKDGGYAKSPANASSSTYHTFLVGLCYQLLGRPLPHPAEVSRFVASRRRDDGGYVEIAPLKRSGTNPTAAAVGLLQLLGADLGTIREGVSNFLAGMASPEGGLRANARAPLADLLSTFTGSWTLAQLGALDRINTAAACRYAASLELPGGGFRGGSWDEQTDVEYTFYGLGVLALLTP
ncbi:MAG TPA: prenyltransferase/squalene oxidase repeat-containing protein [Gemmataceae bacterium]|jgi:geranylgeranyl transferase type-2 subunit beta|nr:prenyltransferase/squalene oxidase repeat-containing protein [Gemmataceae bacterium]